MPIIKSAKKRVKVARKATIRNSKTKRSLRMAIKAFSKSLVGDGKKAAASTAAELSEAQSNLDKAVKKGVLHKNKAARQKRQLAARAKAAGVAPAAAKKATAKAEKPAVKKAAPAKATSKAEKPAAKKTAAKKPAAKK
jgi:small subunit ribosomal protein S20